jgi:methionyl-tRNA formyltransferase
MYDGIDIANWYNTDIPVIEVENINEEGLLLKQMKPDLIMQCGWRQVIKKEILDIPPYGIAGIHFSYLPKNRGQAPIINTILKGIKETGITLYYLDEGRDTGDIIGQEKIIVEDDWYAMDLYEELISKGRKLINEYFQMIIDGKVKRIKQDDSKSSVFEKPSKDINKIDLEKDSIDFIYKKIRALSKPYRGAYIEKDGKKLIIWKAELK